MTTVAIRPPLAAPPRRSPPRRSPPTPTHAPDAISGDRPLNAREVRAYMDFHAARNARNAELSEREQIATLGAPPRRTPLPTNNTPSRAALNTFFAFAAVTLAPRFAGGGKQVTILDLGTGSAPCLAPFEAAGYRGTYIGVDIKRNPRWSDEPTRSFRKRLILGDCLDLDVASLPPLDLIISSTALEHIADDAAAVARFSTRLAPGGAHIHYIPAEAALPLYGPHGWRQYSPRCIRALFPTGTIYRAGGAVSGVVHRLAITGPTQRNEQTWMLRWPRSYRAVRDTALALDRLLGNRPPTMYGVIQA